MKRLAAPVAKMLVGSAVMTGAIFVVKHFLAFPPIPMLCVAIAVGGAVYFAAMAAMGMKGNFRRRK
jgi:peptidoglycan biosynthesis protein MviN/MurJ (putative lipid II flippase)